MVTWFLATQAVQRPLLEAQAWAGTLGPTKGIWPPVSMAVQFLALGALAWAGTWVGLALWFLAAPAWTGMQLMAATPPLRTEDQRCLGKAVPPATRLLPHPHSLSPLPTTLA